MSSSKTFYFACRSLKEVKTFYEDAFFLIYKDICNVVPFTWRIYINSMTSTFGNTTVYLYPSYPFFYIYSCIFLLWDDNRRCIFKRERSMVTITYLIYFQRPSFTTEHRIRIFIRIRASYSFTYTRISLYDIVDHT